jgi:hypothetical protein
MKPSTTKEQQSKVVATHPVPPAIAAEPAAEKVPAIEPVAAQADDGVASTEGSPMPEWLGHVEAMRHRLGIGDVKAFLGDAWDRVEALKGVTSTLRLQDRLRASDGQCPPIVFIRNEAGHPCIFSGFETIAAHDLCGHGSLDALFVAPGDAAEAQSVLASMTEKPKQPNPYDEPASRFTPPS